MIHMAKTYKDFVKTFKFRAKKKSESPRAFIGARGKAMGKAWQKLKKERESKTTKAAKSKKKTTAKKTTTKRKSKK